MTNFAIPSFGFAQHSHRDNGWDHHKCVKCGWVNVDTQHRRGTAAQHDEWFPSMDAFAQFKRTGVRAWVGGSPCDRKEAASAPHNLSDHAVEYREALIQNYGLEKLRDDQVRDGDRT